MNQLVVYSDSSSEDEERRSSDAYEALNLGEQKQEKVNKLKIHCDSDDVRDVAPSWMTSRPVTNSSHKSEDNQHIIDLPITDESDDQSNDLGGTGNVSKSQPKNVTSCLKLQDERSHESAKKNGSSLSPKSRDYDLVSCDNNLFPLTVCSVTKKVKNVAHRSPEKRVHYHDLLSISSTADQLETRHVSSTISAPSNEPHVILNKTNICQKDNTKESHKCVEISPRSEETVQPDSQNISHRKRKFGCDSHKPLPVPDAIHSMYHDRQQRWVDEPAQHDNRVRSFPHLEGNWATHVFIPVPKNDEFVTFVDHLLELLMPQTFQCQPDFHISLSRTVAVRYHWIEPLVDSLRENVKGLKSSISNLTDIKLFTNDEKTRTFVSLELSQDEQELMDYVRAVDKSFAEFKLPAYYQNPSFHISVGWCLGDVAEKISDEKLMEAQEMLGEFVAASPILSFVYAHEICCQAGCKFFVVSLEDSDK